MRSSLNGNKVNLAGVPSVVVTKVCSRTSPPSYSRTPTIPVSLGADWAGLKIGNVATITTSSCTSESLISARARFALSKKNRTASDCGAIPDSLMTPDKIRLVSSGPIPCNATKSVALKPESCRYRSGSLTSGNSWVARRTGPASDPIWLRPGGRLRPRTKNRFKDDFSKRLPYSAQNPLSWFGTPGSEWGSS